MGGCLCCWLGSYSPLCPKSSQRAGASLGASQRPWGMGRSRLHASAWPKRWGVGSGSLSTGPWALQVWLPAQGQEGRSPVTGAGTPITGSFFLFLLHRKMVPRANRWMICLTFLFRVEVKPRPPSVPPASLLHRSAAPWQVHLLGFVWLLNT